MFDRLIESDSAGAEFKSRRRYFIVSTVVVGLLFISAVVISLYAADIGLGNDNYELSAILAPVPPPADAPEPPRPDRQRAAATSTSSDIPIRIVRQQPIEATPVSVPPISTDPSRYRSLPDGPVKIGDEQTGGPRGIGHPTGDGSSSSTTSPLTERTEIIDERPPKVNYAPAPSSGPKPIQAIGIVNGKATDLPKPPYPAAALAMRIEGKVDVQVTIDETGKVISAKAASGNPLLRQAAENAAWKARFTPTLLSRVPIKVTGVIVYNFTRN